MSFDGDKLPRMKKGRRSPAEPGYLGPQLCVRRHHPRLDMKQSLCEKASRAMLDGRK